MTHDELDRRLNVLFREYRQACPDLDGSANFMPQLWQKIEARQTLPLMLGRWTRMFVSFAAALCLAMAVILVVPHHQTSVLQTSYVEALEREHPNDILAYSDVVPDNSGEVSWQ
ncbi:MAG: hypothetical protein IT167_28040 [Bryobacterales bacterium]|nr:hypothetical protein [Bryobacterales bacterium]